MTTEDRKRLLAIIKDMESWRHEIVHPDVLDKWIETIRTISQKPSNGRYD